MDTVGGCHESGGTAAILPRRYRYRRRKRRLGVSGDTPPPIQRPMSIAQSLWAEPISAAGGRDGRHCGTGGRIRTDEAPRTREGVNRVTHGLWCRSLTGCDDGGASREDDDDDEPPPGGTNGRWSPLSGAGLEEMVREATRLAAQLQQSHLSPLPPSPGGGSPRSPRRETFVVKDSPVRALLPTVPAANVPKLSQSRGAALPPPQPEHPVPEPPPAPALPPEAAPPHPVPSPNPPAGLRHQGLHQVGGGSPGPAQQHPEVPPSGWGLPPGADLDPPAAACSPPARRQPAAPHGDSITQHGDTESRGKGDGGGTVRPPPMEKAEAQVGFCFNYKRSHQQ
ncbi:proline/serine-rich coiled-coil protein 1 isoform X3 [Coturnix japonica]|uniref:proline/serine-rich coiled-coil protein 1 isoform X3 n=1 Tax=Coturnix japonica TaxID=93934 RepID=UPI0007776D99|nr:proline/serine-rich coiled-coil protein 1 isoform X3 [Coturnix japonica]